VSMSKHPGRPPLVVAVITMLSTYALIIMASMVLPVAAPIAAKTFEVPARFIGLYTSIVYFGAACATLIAPHLIARFGALRTSQGTVVFAAAGLFALSAGNLVLAAISAFLIGLSYGPGNTASNRLLTAMTSEGKRSGVFSIKQTSVPLGGALAGLIIPPLALLWGWQYAAAAAGLVCLGAAFAVQPWREILDGDRDPEHPIVPRDPVSPVKYVLANPKLRALALTGLVYSGMQYAFGAIMVAFLVERAGVSAIEAGLILSAAMISSVIFRLAWGYIADLTRPDIILGLIGLLTAGSVVAAMFVDPRWSLSTLLALGCWFGAAGYSWNGVFLALIADYAGGDDVATATSGSMTLVFIGSLSFPAFFTGLLVLSGYSLALGSVAAVTAVTAVYAYLQLRKP
jgi:MFS family permease